MATEVAGLQWGLSWSAPLFGLLVAATAALVLLAARSAAGLPFWRRTALIGLRATVATGLALSVMQPTWVELRPRGDDRRVAVVLDGSRSMAVSSPTSRIELAAADVAALKSAIRTRVYLDHGAGAEVQPTVAGEVTLEAEGAAPSGGSDESLTATPAPTGGPTQALIALDDTPRKPADWRALATGGTTDILGALGRLQERERSAGLGSVVWIGDGRDHGGLASLDDEALRETLAALAVPVHTVAVGDEEPLADVSVVAVRLSRQALARAPLPIEVELSLGAFAGRPGALKVQVELDGRPISHLDVALVGDALRRLKLEVVPTTVGAHVVSVRAVPLADEVTQANNAVHVPIDVVRDRTRVLHLAGHPSWDSRFARALLRAEPTVDLVSFYIMVGRGGGTIAAEETTLIPFPTRQLFGESLDDIDLLIFHDFAFHQFDIDRLIPSRIGPWIQQGGALLVVGGRQSLTAGGWQDTSILPWLPIQIGSGEDAFRDPEAHMRLTEVGASHPVARLRRDVDENRAAWKAATVPGTHSGQVARSGDPVLVERDDGAPLLAVGERGQGRVAALATSGLWTWAMGANDERSRAESRSDFATLWRHLRGWLVRDPAYQRLHLSAPRTAVLPGTEARIEVRWLAADHRPVADAWVDASDTPLPLQPDAAQVPRNVRCRTDAEGRCALHVLAWPPGPHLLEARSEGGGIAQTAWAVAEAAAEDADPRPDRTSLQRIADASGGKLVARAADLTPADLVGTELQDLERVRTALWGHPATLACLLLLLGVEWTLRRRWGLR